MIFVGQSSAAPDRPTSGGTLLARSRLAERMQAAHDEGQRLFLDLVTARSAATVPGRAARKRDPAS